MAGGGLGQKPSEEEDTEKGKDCVCNLWPKEDFKNQGKEEGYLSKEAMFNDHRTVNTMGLSTLKTTEDYHSSQD